MADPLSLMNFKFGMPNNDQTSTFGGASGKLTFMSGDRELQIDRDVAEQLFDAARLVTARADASEGTIATKDTKAAAQELGNKLQLFLGQELNPFASQDKMNAETERFLGDLENLSTKAIAKGRFDNTMSEDAYTLPAASIEQAFMPFFAPSNSAPINALSDAIDELLKQATAGVSAGKPSVGKPGVGKPSGEMATTGVWPPRAPVETKPAPVTATRVSDTYTGVEMARFIDAKGGGVMIDGPAKGLGIGDDMAINGADALTITPPKGTQGAKIDLTDLNRGEEATVRIQTQQGQWLEMAVKGDADGNVTANLPLADAKKIEISASENSDFQVKAMTFERYQMEEEERLQMETETLRGFDAMKMLSGDGMRIVDGFVGMKGGKQKDEIDGNEKMVFTPPKDAEESSLMLAKLFKGEEAVLQVQMKDGRMATIRVQGDEDGKVEVPLGGDVKRVVISPGRKLGEKDGTGSDFAIDGIKISRATEAPAPTTPGVSGPAPLTPGGDAVNLGLQLAQALSVLNKALTDAPIPDERKAELLVKVAEASQAFAEAFGTSSEGGREITPAELRKVFDPVNAIITENAGTPIGSKPVEDALGQVQGSIQNVIDELKAKQQASAVADYS